MNPSELPITSGQGTQNATQDPQTAGSSAGSGTPSSSVQPGATNTLDTVTGGVPLINRQLPTIALTQKPSGVALPTTAKAGLSPGIIVLAVVLFAVAAFVVANIFLPAKNTTE